MNGSVREGKKCKGALSDPTDWILHCIKTTFTFLPFLVFFDLIAGASPSECLRDRPLLAAGTTATGDRELEELCRGETHEVPELSLHPLPSVSPRRRRARWGRRHPLPSGLARLVGKIGRRRTLPSGLARLVGKIGRDIPFPPDSPG